MDSSADPGSPATGSKRRRIPKACGACRRSKVRCDEQRPCGRCRASSLECLYVERPPDPVAERFERLENAISGLQARLDSRGPPTPEATQSANSTDSESARPGPAGPAGVSSFTLREGSRKDVVTAGLVSEGDARAWFNTFFEGCDRFVPVFDRNLDTFISIRARSVILFDTLVAFGSRASCGVLSRPWRQMYGFIRSRTSELVLKISSGESAWTMEDIQALLVIASYSDSGAVLVDVALRAAMHAGLPTRLDRLFTSLVNAEPGGLRQTINEPTLFWTSRVWYGIFVLDSILSLDGGKPPSVVLHASSRRVRMLLSHPQRTSTDMRLFAQVELNDLRTASYQALDRATSASQSFTALQDVLTGAQVDLKLWLSEWETIGYSDASLTDEHPVMLLNLRIQHVWATLTLHLRALTASGIENIALMDEGQRSIALAAKLAAEQHLQLLLTDVPIEGAPPIIPYVSSLKYAMEFGKSQTSRVPCITQLTVLFPSMGQERILRPYRSTPRYPPGRSSRCTLATTSRSKSLPE